MPRETFSSESCTTRQSAARGPTRRCGDGRSGQSSQLLSYLCATLTGPLIGSILASRCVFNLDSMLSRMLSTPPNFALAATHSGLPEALDPDTLAWNAYFVDHQEPAIGPAREPTLAAGFVLLCEANLLATEAIKELYPPGRDRSEDWKAVDSKTDLTNKIEWYEHRLDEQRSRVSGFMHYNGSKASVDVLSLALKDLFAEVGLLISESRSFALSTRPQTDSLTVALSSCVRESAASSTGAEDDMGSGPVVAPVVARDRRGRAL